jgi:DtxR family Mn-dependent transcriptional regulator
MHKEAIPLPDHKISDAMRDYLSEIYRLGQGEAWVSTSALAEKMEVSGPAAVRMVRRLHKGGLVDHLPYKGVNLTPPGKRVALLHIRRHRLVERFLVNVLKFDWDDVHEAADVLHRGIDQRLEDRIDDLMEHPATCPHGDPIPTRNGVMPEINDKPLNVVPSGTQGTVSRVKTHEPDKLRYLAEIGLIPGASFELINRAPFNGPFRLKVGRDEQIIGTELASALWVLTPPPKRPETTV